MTFYLVSHRSRAVGIMMLWRVIYTWFVMPDGHNLFEEVHQADPMGAVDVVGPNCKDRENGDNDE